MTHPRCVFRASDSTRLSLHSDYVVYRPQLYRFAVRREFHSAGLPVVPSHLLPLRTSSVQNCRLELATKYQDLKIYINPIFLVLRENLRILKGYKTAYGKKFSPSIQRASWFAFGHWPWMSRKTARFNRVPLCVPRARVSKVVSFEHYV